MHLLPLRLRQHPINARLELQATPRLELQAADLSARLLVVVIKEHDYMTAHLFLDRQQHCVSVDSWSVEMPPCLYCQPNWRDPGFN